MGASARDTAIIGSRYVRPGLRGLESRPRRLAGAYAPTLAAEDEVRRDNHPFELLRRIPLLLVVRRRPRVAALAVRDDVDDVVREAHTKAGLLQHPLLLAKLSEQEVVRPVGGRAVPPCERVTGRRRAFKSEVIEPPRLVGVQLDVERGVVDLGELGWGRQVETRVLKG